ncbi:MAG: zinc ABC transporter substrate-binding protein [Candidatus Gracilibacteria bacterium]
MKKIYLTLAALALIGIAMLFFRGVQSTPSSSPKKLTIVSTIYPFADLAEKIAKDRAYVVTIVPGGVEPHEYEPTPQSIVAIKNSNIFIYNGFSSMEPWIAKVLPLIPEVTSINTSSLISTLPDNPHFWLDPENDKKIADKIRDILMQKDPVNAAFYRQNTDALKIQFTNIDQMYQAELSTSNCSLRDVVVAHDAYAYMAKKYHIITHPIAGLSPDTEPDAQTIAQLINLVRQRNIPYILFEELATPKIAETIAKEADVKTLMLSPIEGLTAEEMNEGQDMISIMKNNLATLKLAMKCK